MTDKELMQQALDALEYIDRLPGFVSREAREQWRNKAKSPMAEMRERLERLERPDQHQEVYCAVVYEDGLELLNVSVMRSYADESMEVIHEVKLYSFELEDALKAEREACAQLCLSIEPAWLINDLAGWRLGRVNCAAAIRARREKK